MAWKNKERAREYSRAYKARNKEALRAKAREYRLKNLEREKARCREWYYANKDKDKAWRNTPAAKRNEKNFQLRRKYGITLVQYAALLATQGHKCAICKLPADKFKTQLAVDHCHSSGKVRGLLCSRCNTGLGQFKDCVETVINAASYLAMKGI